MLFKLFLFLCLIALSLGNSDSTCFEKCEGDYADNQLKKVCIAGCRYKGLHEFDSISGSSGACISTCDEAFTDEKEKEACKAPCSWNTDVNFKMPMHIRFFVIRNRPESGDEVGNSLGNVNNFFNSAISDMLKRAGFANTRFASSRIVSNFPSDTFGESSEEGGFVRDESSIVHPTTSSNTHTGSKRNSWMRICRYLPHSFAGRLMAIALLLIFLFGVVSLIVAIIRNTKRTRRAVKMPERDTKSKLALLSPMMVPLFQEEKFPRVHGPPRYEELDKLNAMSAKA